MIKIYSLKDFLAGLMFVAFGGVAVCLAQAGVPEYDFSTWTGLVAPANTPPAIVDRLFKEITKALNQPAVKEAFAKQAMVVKPNESPEAFKQFIKKEIDRIRKVVQAADIKPEG
jgi:tripartite-type tricarboxylate transporter receptor subunit TctC